MRSFWSAWSKDYLNQLQSRSKWKNLNRTVGVGDIVIVKDDLLHPALWPIARVERVWPGGDGEVRVVEVLVDKSRKKRAISKLIPIL